MGPSEKIKVGDLVTLKFNDKNIIKSLGIVVGIEEGYISDMGGEATEERARILWPSVVYTVRPYHKLFPSSQFSYERSSMLTVIQDREKDGITKAC